MVQLSVIVPIALVALVQFGAAVPAPKSTKGSTTTYKSTLSSSSAFYKTPTTSSTFYTTPTTSSTYSSSSTAYHTTPSSSSSSYSSSTYTTTSSSSSSSSQTRTTTTTTSTFATSATPAATNVNQVNQCGNNYNAYCCTASGFSYSSCYPMSMYLLHSQCHTHVLPVLSVLRETVADKALLQTARPRALKPLSAATLIT